MADMGIGKTVYHLRMRIDEIQKELSKLGKPVPDIQEIITSTNLLRSNERLSKIDEKQNRRDRSIFYLPLSGSCFPFL